jgi:hypothetical protein
MKTSSHDKNVINAKTFSDKRFHVETLKIQNGGLKSKYYIFASWKLRSFIGSLILKLKTLATNKTKYIAFQVYNDLGTI